MAQNLINVSNRLPVTVDVGSGQISRSSGGLVAALEGLSTDQYTLHWLGWPGGAIEEPARQQKIEQVLESEYGCTPVFLSDQEMRGHYDGLSNTSIWPLLHYMPSKFRYEDSWWEQYLKVNRRFCEKVIAIARPGDIVWVHDYQLMLLPTMLREAEPTLRIGFFLHTPFPSYEVFRLHPDREALVAGLLGADLIGFHTFGYMRHFRSSVLRLLGIESEITRIRHHGHTARLGIYPIGINARKFEAELSTVRVKEQIEQFRRNFDHKQIILSVERLDYTKGILQRLTAIEHFLEHSSERDRLKFIFVSVPSREGVAEYQVLREEVESRIGHLNGRYATLTNSPIHFIHGSVESLELTALYALADVGLVTPLIDGMNLVAKEFVACQRDEPGVLVLSEFAGAAQELFDAIIVNPYDTVAVADAIAQALAMPAEEKASRMANMRQRVMTVDAPAWARSFVEDMAASEPAREVVEGDVSEAQQSLREAILRGRKVAVFLDYDGTLREIERDPAAARPNEAVTTLLRKLSNWPDLDVTIISGRTPSDLESFLGEYPFGLIAEHGAFLRRPHHREWEQLDRTGSYSWKDEIMKLLRLYQESTPGTWIESKRTSLVWHYRRADPELGSWKARQLTEELASFTANEPIEVRHGRKIVEVTASHVNKGAAVMRIVEGSAYELMLAAGDDATDESMFRLDLAHLITIKVGDRETHAQYRLPHPAAFRRFLGGVVG